MRLVEHYSTQSRTCHLELVPGFVYVDAVRCRSCIYCVLGCFRHILAKLGDSKVFCTTVVAPSSLASLVSIYWARGVRGDCQCGNVSSFIVTVTVRAAYPHLTLSSYRIRLVPVRGPLPTCVTLRPFLVGPNGVWRTTDESMSIWPIGWS